MKGSYLLPHIFKKIGLCMVVPFLALGISCMTDTIDLCLSARLPAIIVDIISDIEWFTMYDDCIIDEIAMLGLLISLIFIALSRERDEDEMTLAIRMKSFVWSAWGTFIVMTIGILFFFGMAFVHFMIIAMYLYLALYCIKFNFPMYKERKV